MIKENELCEKCGEKEATVEMVNGEKVCQECYDKIRDKFGSAGSSGIN